MAQLDGKVALITGAGGMKGIGRACALKLAAQGADIVLSDFKREQKDLPPQEVKAGWRSIDSVAEEVERLGRRCLKIWCDLTVTGEIEDMARRAQEHYGHVDILVNNARAIIGRDRVGDHRVARGGMGPLRADQRDRDVSRHEVRRPDHGRAGQGRAHHQHGVRRLEARPRRGRPPTTRRSSPCSG